MSIRDITVVALPTQADETACAAARALATAHGAHLSALRLAFTPEPGDAADGMDLALAAGAWGNAGLAGTEVLGREWRKLGRSLRVVLGSATVRQLDCDRELAGEAVADEAKHADLTIMLRPEKRGQEGQRRQIFEAVLFGSGRPILLVPPGWDRQAIGRNIAIAWNGQREAARALADAAPFLDMADRITIVIVETSNNLEMAGGPFGDRVGAHLARRGLKAQVHSIRSGDSKVGTTLLNEAAKLGADLVVMGGYGRPRLEELAFGGVTRTLSRTANVPLLMSH